MRRDIRVPCVADYQTALQHAMDEAAENREHEQNDCNDEHQLCAPKGRACDTAESK
jgi:hypothetical protein